MAKSFPKSVLVFFLVGHLVQAVTLKIDYIGCFKENLDHPFSDFTPGDYDASRVTPLICVHLCSSYYRYAAITGGDVCLCGSQFNVTQKVNDSYCSVQCPGSRDKLGSRDDHVLGLCGGVFYYSMYEAKGGIWGLKLNISAKIPLLLTTWFNASVLMGDEVQFRFQINDEDISPFSKTSSVSHVFRDKGEHRVRVTARNELAGYASTEKIVNVIDTYDGVKLQCPAISLPHEEITCKGEWVGGDRPVQFHFGDGVVKNVFYDPPSYRVGADINQAQKISQGDNVTLRTFVFVSAVIPESGQVSHWEIVASKPGKIRVQVFRPICSTEDRICKNQFCSSKNDSCPKPEIPVSCPPEQSLCLSRKRCVPANGIQRASDDCDKARDNNTILMVGYRLLDEDVFDISSAGYRTFIVPHDRHFAVKRLDVIGWTSDGGQLSYQGNTMPQIGMFEYPVIGPSGSNLFRKPYPRIHFASHALAAYVRQTVKFELRHVYVRPGFYRIFSLTTPPLFISVDHPISPFELKVPRLTSTNLTTLLQTENHNGSNIRYRWNVGDGSAANSSNSSIIHVYNYPGWFSISLFAINAVSNYSVTVTIEVLDRIKRCQFNRPIRATVFGQPTLMEWHCLSGCNVTFSVNFGDGLINISYPRSRKYVGSRFSHVYSSAGSFSVVIGVTSPVGPNVSLTSEALVEIPIGSLEVRLLTFPSLRTLHIATSREITLERVLLRGTLVNCEFDFGDSTAIVVQAGPQVNHSYYQPGTYHVNVTCCNHVSCLWRILNTTIIVHHLAPLKNLSLDVFPAILGNPSVFEFKVIRGNLFKCSWDFGDGHNHTTTFPLTNTSLNHLYHDVGTYTATVTCRNDIGKSSVTVLADIDNPIRNATIVNKNQVIQVNQSFEFVLKWTMGTRVKYCVDCDDVSNDANDVGDRITMTTIKHAYTKSGKYSLGVRVWNSVSSSHVTVDKLITVQNPVKGIQLLVSVPSRCPSLSLAACLYLSANILPPSNASVFFNFGNGSTTFYENIDLARKICAQKRNYPYPGIYNVTANVTNRVSSQFLVVSVLVRRRKLEGVKVVYKNGSRFQRGMGSSNQYFPAGSIVRFELEHDVDDVGIEWRTGNESLKETRKGFFEHVFVSRGCQEVTAVIRNVRLEEHCSRYICIQRELEDFSFNVKRPTYFRDPTVFLFSWEKEDVFCVKLSLGDNTTVKFGNASCELSHQIPAAYLHKYRARGNYTVTLVIWNHVSSIQRDITVGIWDEACPILEVHIAGGGPKNRPLIVRSWEVIVLKPIVTHKCHVAKTVEIYWELFVVGNVAAGFEERYQKRMRSTWREIAVSKNSTSDLRGGHFRLLIQGLPTELYLVKLTVTFTGVDRDLVEVKQTSYSWLEVFRSPLVAHIKGGISRSISSKLPLVLDGSDSYDPDMFTSAPLEFSWSCRLDNSSIDWISNTTQANCCEYFKNHSAMLSNSSVITLETKDLIARQKFIFRLKVKEGTRQSYFEQVIIVVDGPAPSIDFKCVLNCEETVNPSQRLVLKSRCLNCEPSTRLFYQWSIYVCSFFINTSKSSCNEINFEMKTSTGLRVANLATLPNVLNIGTSYKVRCSAWRSGSERVGFVEYLFVVNRPPTGRSCAVDPRQGYALKTMFNVRCVGWDDEDLPLTYLIEMRNGEDNLYLSSGKTQNMNVVLPLGDRKKNFTLEVVVKVVDAKLFSTSTVHTVKVLKPYWLDYDQVMQDVRKAIDDNENAFGFGMVVSLCSILNSKFNTSRKNISEAKDIRMKIAKILRTTNVSGFDEVRGMSDTLRTLTAEPSEISLETQSEVTQTIQNKMDIFDGLSHKSRAFLVIGTILHQVVSNIVDAALLTSAEYASMATENDTIATKETNRSSSVGDVKLQRTESGQEVFSTLDQINNLILSQTVAGDRAAVIHTTNYDVHLKKQSLDDLTSNNGSLTGVKVKFKDARSFVENANLSLYSVLGLVVLDISTNVSGLYPPSAHKINSNVLRTNLNYASGLPVSLTMVDMDVFVDRKPSDSVAKVSEIYSLISQKSLRIHSFNRTAENTALVLELNPVETKLVLYAFLRTGQPPSFENSEFQAIFSSTSSQSPPYTWVLPHDLLSNFSSSGVQQYFLGVTRFGDEPGINNNYTLRVFWVKCLMSKDLQDAWKTSGCKVGSQTTSHRIHCVCRPGQPELSSESARHATRNRRGIPSSRHLRSTKSKMFSSKAIFKISIGAGVFPVPNKIHFQFVFDTNISHNPLALIAVSVVFGVYLILLIYARRKDHNDSEKIGMSASPDNGPSDKYLYEVTIYTGCACSAGTTANVSIIVSGLHDDLPPKVLSDPKRRCFQRAGIDTFLISSPDYIGEIKYLQIWHDNAGFSAAWLLDKIVVRDLNDEKSYLFLNEAWLAVETDGGAVQTILFPASYKEITEFKRLFNTTTKQSLRDRHLWFSVFARPVDSRFTRVQRLSCCLTLVCSTMLANAMFYRRGGTTSVDSTMTVGPFVFGVSEIMIGMMSSLVILPVNVVIVWIFQNVEPKPSKEEVEAVKERSWWFYQRLFCCFKSKMSSPTFTSIMSESDTDNSIFEWKCSVDENERIHSAAEDAHVEDNDVQVQFSKKSKEKSRLLKTFVLPYCYIHVAWSTLCLTSITCSVFVVFYGLQFGKDVCAQWLSSMTISFIQDVLISEPLKVFAIAAVVSLIIKKPQHPEHSVKFCKKFRDYQPQNNCNREGKIPPSAEVTCLKPPGKRELQIARAKRLKETRTGALLKELVLYILFLVCLSVVTYRNKNPSSFEFQKRMQDLFVSGGDSRGKSFLQIHDIESFYAWTSDTLLNNLDSLSYWPNKNSSAQSTDRRLDNLYVLGLVRLRQTRVKEKSCFVSKHFREKIKKCHGSYSENTRDTSCYDVAWKPVPVGSQCNPNSSADPWKYISASHYTSGSPASTPLTDDSGGFVVDVQRSNRSQTFEAITFLKTHKWIDARTRSISVEINLYSAPLNLFCLGKLEIKLLPTNGMRPHARFLVSKLFALSGVLDSFSVIGHIFVFVFFLIFIYRELKQVYHLKLKYFSDFWNCLQGLIVLVILSGTVVFFLRLGSVKKLLTFLEKEEKHFVSFDHVAFLDMMLAYLIAFVVFVSWLRLVKFLRFNRRLSFLQDTLGKVTKPLSAFSVIFLPVFLAYVHFGYLLFSRKLATFRDVSSSFVSIFSLLLGHFDFPTMENANRILGPVFLFFAIFFGVFIIMNLFVALILESFLLVKDDAMNRENDYQLLEYVAKQLRAWIGMSRDPSSSECNPAGGLTCGFMSDNGRSTSYVETSRRKQRQLKDRVSKGSASGLVEKIENRLELGLESVMLEDWAEEVFLHRLFWRGLKLNAKQNDHESDVKEDGNNRKKGEEKQEQKEGQEGKELEELRQELYDVADKYSQESEVDEDLVKEHDRHERNLPLINRRRFSPFDLSIEVNINLFPHGKVGQ